MTDDLGEEIEELSTRYGIDPCNSWNRFSRRRPQQSEGRVPECLAHPDV